VRQEAGFASADRGNDWQEPGYERS